MAENFNWTFCSGWASAARDIGDPPLADIVDWLTRRRDSVTAGRSSIRVGHVDFFARPIGNALSRQIAVEQHLVVELMCVHLQAQGLIGALDRRQDEARPSRAENDRRDHHMQPVEAAGGEKARQRIGAAFDQHPMHAALGEGSEDVIWCDHTIRCWKRDNLHARRRRALRAFRRHQQPADAVIGKDLGAPREAGPSGRSRRAPGAALRPAAPSTADRRRARSRPR